MRHKLLESSASRPIGEAGGSKLMRVTVGEYAGRVAVLTASDANTIKLTWADAPYTVWSTPATIVTDAADSSFDCRIESDGDIHLVYSEQSNYYLVTRKLSFSSGCWSVGSKVTIYNGSQCYSPSLAIEPSGTLWVSYCQLSAPNRTVYVKSSTDGGSTWGSGAADGGDAIGGTGTIVYSKTIIGLNDIYVVYCYSSQYLAMRTKPLSGGSWTAATVIGTGSSLGGDFDVAVRTDGMLAVAFCAMGLYYREYDGSVWSAAEELDTGAPCSPNLRFTSNEPVIVYFEAFPGVQRLIRQVARSNGQFGTPAALDVRANLFASVLIYGSTPDSYVDRTSEASDSITGDTAHPSTGCMLKDSGDCLYLGMDAPFRYIQTTMSQAGIGGTVQFSYYNGSTWTAFTPASGATSFGSSPDRAVLWPDYASIPSDWQESLVNGESQFWIKIEVNSAFSTGPLGTQITAIAEAGLLIVRR